MMGPYGVGYREFQLKTGNKPWVSVYYPIDKQVYEELKDNPEFNIQKMRDGFKAAEGLARGFNAGPHFLFRYHTQSRVQVVKNFRLHRDFTNNEKGLIPVFFSHGLVFNRNKYSAICRELASNGCIVYSFDHTDGSCSYFLDETIDPPRETFYTEYDAKIHAFTHEEYRRRQIAVRLNDVEQLLRYVKETEVIENPSIDLSKLCYCGHSMGGLTAIESCRKFDENFKY